MTFAFSATAEDVNSVRDRLYYADLPEVIRGFLIQALYGLAGNVSISCSGTLAAQTADSSSASISVSKVA